jgi:serine/threonine protein kinase
MPGDTAAHRRGLVIKDRYELDRMPLAHGGMGEVWTGRDTRLDREIAVKFIRFPDGLHDEELVRRFVRESRITARLEHPGVPAVYDVGTHDGRPYLVMQRIHGISVADLIAEHGPLAVGWAAAIAAQACAVLAVAHDASLVHRDLKPANLMLDRDGGVKVLDFGLAVALDLAEQSQITRSGQTLGTPAYMAPEQILASKSDPLTDLYGLGCTLYEMLTGAPVFSGPTAYAVMSSQVDAPPRPPRALRPQVPLELESLVLHLLEKKPEDRPPDATAVYRRLIPFATGLPAMPGILRPPRQSSAVRMYASMLARVFPDDGPVTNRPARPEDPPAAPSLPPSERPPDPPGRPVRDARQPVPSGLGRTDLDRLRAEATGLARQSRYSQAAALLADAVAPASRALGPADADVLSLRVHLADILFDGGDYRAAGPAYHRLVADLARAADADPEAVMRCRLREATCHALTGQTSRALRQMHDLLGERTRTIGADDPRTLELRRQIGLLQLGAGQRDAARHSLGALAADLTRLHGPDHPEVRAVRELLNGLADRA